MAMLPKGIGGNLECVPSEPRYPDIIDVHRLSIFSAIDKHLHICRRSGRLASTDGNDLNLAPSFREVDICLASFLPPATVYR